MVLISLSCMILIKSQDALSLTEFELMELLDVGLVEVKSAIAHISEVVCPPCQTVDIHTLLSYRFCFYVFFQVSQK